MAAYGVSVCTACEAEVDGALFVGGGVGVGVVVAEGEEGSVEDVDVC